jgi:phage terminase large subunit-like protein
VSEDRLARLRSVVERLTPPQLRAFAHSLDDPDDVALLEEVIGEMASEAERSADSLVHWRADPARMGHHLNPGRGPGQVTLWLYVALLGEAFARTSQVGAGRLIVNLPAQYGKSTLGSQWGPAWHVDRWPDRSLILASYGDELAERNALAVRDILEGHGDVLRARLRRDQRRKDRFLTDEGGGVLATGINSTATGFPAHGVVIDDPFKGWPDAHSEANRQRVWNQYRSVFRLRLTTDEAWVVVAMTRWHEQDLCGRLQQEAWDGTGEEFEVLRLPEVAEAPDPTSANPLLRQPDPLGRQPGQILEPERFGEAAVAAKRLTLGPYLWAGLAQQRPAPEEGTDILRAWFQLEETLPARADEAITSWDMKLKDKEAGDYVVGQCWWRVGGGYWLVEQLRGQWNEATTKVAMALMMVRHPEVRRHYYENAGNAPELTAELRRGEGSAYVLPSVVADKLGMVPAEREAVQALLRRGLSSLVPVTPKGDKRVRMRAVSPVIAGLNVHLPAGAPFVPQYLEEMAAFPNGANDDQVDATSQALSKLSRPAAAAGSPGATADGPRVPTRPSAVAGSVPGGGAPASGRTAVILPGVARR